MASKPKVLIITGYGLNCENESRYAWETAGADVDFVHFHDLLDEPSKLHAFQVTMFIGGFSYGDHMGSGQVFALRVRNRFQDDLQKFIEAGKLIMGVCNGFQIMMKLGLVPGLGGDYFTQKLSLMQNDCGTFQNHWVELGMEPASPCVFTRGMDRMPLPIRHGEGKVYTLDKGVLDRLEAEGCVACRYMDPATGTPAMAAPHNPNGSLRSIAGICDPSGRIFGMMPHPEAYLFPENHPRWDLDRHRSTLAPEGLGLQFFRNAVAYLR